MSPSQDFSEPVRGTEDALRQLIAHTSMKERATGLGLKCHTRVSEIEARVTRSDVESYLVAYGPERVLLLMRAFPAFREAVIASTAATAAADPAQYEQSLVDVASAFAKSIETIVQRLPQGITLPELREIDENLAQLQTVMHRTRLNVGRKIRNFGQGD